MRWIAVMRLTLRARLCCIQTFSTVFEMQLKDECKIFFFLLTWVFCLDS